MECTEGTLLDGRVRYAQPAKGFRSGIEPVLLAAAVPARPGQRVLEAGSGAGAALLCLATRVPGISGVGIEIDPALAALARRNAAANALPNLIFLAADILVESGLDLFHHACANPPYHQAGGTPSPDPARARAKIAPARLFASWIGAMAARLRPRGTLTLILPAAAMPACLASLGPAGCGSACLLPLWPRADQPAKFLLLQAIKGGRGPFRLLPGLTLHNTPSRGTTAGFTPAAEEILRRMGALTLSK
jgi:tRNA1(Val) A37 N6-methylase TrmN6